ncbi:hypothetical protein ACRAWD_05850 [Caulobacter segnis]
MTCTPDSPQADSFTAEIPLAAGPVELGVEVDFERLRFGFRQGGPDSQNERERGPGCRRCSTPRSCRTRPARPARRTSPAFVGMACQDTSGAGAPADFDWFAYEGREYRT